LAVFQRAKRVHDPAIAMERNTSTGYIIEPDGLPAKPGVSEGAIRWAFFVMGVIAASAVWMWV
jgi:hypothetical protein